MERKRIMIEGARDIAVYIRDKMDSYAGKELPDDFRQEFIDLCNDDKIKKKIFKGKEFRSTFKTVLRDDRVMILREILYDAGFSKC